MAQLLQRLARGGGAILSGQEDTPMRRHENGVHI